MLKNKIRTVNKFKYLTEIIQNNGLDSKPDMARTRKLELTTVGNDEHNEQESLPNYKIRHNKANWSLKLSTLQNAH